MIKDAVMTKARRESMVSSKKQRECLESDLIGEIYYLVNSAGNNETAAELEVDLKLEEALGTLENGASANNIIELAWEYGAEAREAGFKQGFHTAMKLCMEGMQGGIF